MKLDFSTIQAALATPPAVFLETPVVTKKPLTQEQVKRNVVSSIRSENNLLRDDLERIYGGYTHDSCYRGVMRYNSCKGDAFHFQESNEIGRLQFAQESGLFCNLQG